MPCWGKKTPGMPSVPLPLLYSSGHNSSPDTKHRANPKPPYLRYFSRIHLREARLFLVSLTSLFPLGPSLPLVTAPIVTLTPFVPLHALPLEFGEAQVLTDGKGWPVSSVLAGLGSYCLPRGLQSIDHNIWFSGQLQAKHMPEALCSYMWKAGYLSSREPQDHTK